MRSPVIYSVTHDILGDPFWAVYDRGVADARDCFGCDVRTFRPQRYSPAGMRTIIESVARDRPDGLLCTIPDARMLEPPLRAAIAAGVAVVAANARDPRKQVHRIPYLLYIGGDDRDGGELAGRRLLAAGAGHDVICFDHYLVDQSCHADRYAGLREIIIANGGSSRRVAIPGDDPDAATAQIRVALEENPAVDGIVTLGPPGAHAALRASEGIMGTLQHVSFDFSEEQLAALRDRRLLAIIDSQQYLQGFIGVQLLCMYLRYGLLPASDILTGPALVDASNMAAAERAFQTGAR
ncbi:MAG TPA: substrate-binding domain-containing protein [Bryobacteraceae bacterium]|nr:substrate-binding domain-containing protein [Bryobacteraceae bacterium]